MLDYWPVGKHGCILITTRNHNLAFEPAEAGIELHEFNRSEGAQLVLYLLSRDIAGDITTQDSDSVLELSEELHGHALAISQITGLIHKGQWAIGEFLKYYDKNTRKISGPRGKTTLETIWKLSFESLNVQCKAFLGVLSYLMPEEIPQGLFEPSDVAMLPGALRFCSDDFECVLLFLP